MSRNREEKFMAIEYLGLSEINGPLVVLEGVKNASYEEIVEFHMDDGTRKIASSLRGMILTVQCTLTPALCASRIA